MDGDGSGFTSIEGSRELATEHAPVRPAADFRRAPHRVHVEEDVVCALFHDMGDTLGSFNHAEVAAAILEPFVSPEDHWRVEQYGIFRGDSFFHHLGLERSETVPLEAFEPMVRRLFAARKQSIDKSGLPDSRAA